MLISIPVLFSPNQLLLLFLFCSSTWPYSLFTTNDVPAPNPHPAQVQLSKKLSPSPCPSGNHSRLFQLKKLVCSYFDQHFTGHSLIKWYFLQPPFQVELVCRLKILVEIRLQMREGFHLLSKKAFSWYHMGQFPLINLVQVQKRFSWDDWGQWMLIVLNA